MTLWLPPEASADGRRAVFCSERLASAGRAAGVSLSASVFHEVL